MPKHTRVRWAVKGEETTTKEEAPPVGKSIGGWQALEDAEWTLAELCGTWSDQRGSTYTLDLDEGGTNMDVCTTRPSGGVIQTRGLIRVEKRSDGSGRVVWGRGGPRVQYTIANLDDESMTWERAGSKPFDWHRVSSPPHRSAGAWVAATEVQENCDESYENNYEEDEEYEEREDEETTEPAPHGVEHSRRALLRKGWRGQRNKHRGKADKYFVADSASATGRQAVVEKRNDQFQQQDQQKYYHHRGDEAASADDTDWQGNDTAETTSVSVGVRGSGGSGGSARGKTSRAARNAARKQRKNEDASAAVPTEEGHTEALRGLLGVGAPSAGGVGGVAAGGGGPARLTETSGTVGPRGTAAPDTAIANTGGDGSSANSGTPGVTRDAAGKALKAMLGIEHAQQAPGQATVTVSTPSTTSTAVSTVPTSSTSAVSSKSVSQQCRVFVPPEGCDIGEKVLAALRPDGPPCMRNLPLGMPEHAATPPRPMQHHGGCIMSTDAGDRESVARLESTVQTFLTQPTMAQQMPLQQAAYGQPALVWPTDLRQIALQLEYYFSEENLCKDPYLRSLMTPEGWVSLGPLTAFPRMQYFGVDALTIRQALMLSTQLELDGTACYVRIRDVMRRGRWVHRPLC
eukprot:TRINITY_DN69167_c0_g1_i1.p1 TRINITY_DN69167_c0_g1~~TRINITY_DN69167_c0_g1_i1.p1  ORF type:complete len:630 (-),score=104.07 TRINITY_DN69167_c0_g1_i1:157-2046(-)